MDRGPNLLAPGNALSDSRTRTAISNSSEGCPCGDPNGGGRGFLHRNHWPNITTTAGAVVSGRVVKAEVREGDPVERGKTLLMQIDRTSREIALRAADASVAKNREKWQRLRRGYRLEEVAQRRAESEEQKAILPRIEQDFKRGERLHRDELISLAELERLQSEFRAAKEKHGQTLAALQMAEAGPRREEIAEAEAELREAQARYDLIAYELDRTTLRAPLTGFLVRKYVEVGTWVKTGNPIADLVDLNLVYASGPVGERKISLLQKALLRQWRWMPCPDRDL